MVTASNYQFHSEAEAIAAKVRFTTRGLTTSSPWSADHMWHITVLHY